MNNEQVCRQILQSVFDMRRPELAAFYLDCHFDPTRSPRGSYVVTLLRSDDSPREELCSLALQAGENITQRLRLHLECMEPACSDFVESPRPIRVAALRGERYHVFGFCAKHVGCTRPELLWDEAIRRGILPPDGDAEVEERFAREKLERRTIDNAMALAIGPAHEQADAIIEKASRYAREWMQGQAVVGLDPASDEGHRSGLICGAGGEVEVFSVAPGLQVKILRWQDGYGPRVCEIVDAMLATGGVSESPELYAEAQRRVDREKEERERETKRVEDGRIAYNTDLESARKRAEGSLRAEALERRRIRRATLPVDDQRNTGTPSWPSFDSGPGWED